MTTLKTVISSVFIGLVVATFTVALLGATGVLTLQDGTLHSFFLVLGLELCAVITAVFRTQDFFKDDPNSVANLKRKHSEEITKVQKEKTETESSLRTEIERLKAAHAAEIKKMRDDHMRSIQQMRNAPRQVPNFIASGSARTQQKPE